MPTMLSLEDNKGNTIFTWDRHDSKWWTTGFNPNYQGADASKLSSVGTIDFSKQLDLWNAFKKEYHDSPIWSFDSKTHIATFNWKADN